MPLDIMIASDIMTSMKEKREVFTLRMPKETSERLRKLSYTSRKSRNDLILEAIELLFKIPEHENR